MSEPYLAAPFPPDEEERLRAVRGLEILDTPPEPAFDRLTRLAARLLKAPMALLSLVEENRQWFKSRVGLDICETSREVAFCAHALTKTEPLVVLDALQDSRFSSH
ncbi:MAG: GAF domain-containing protein, partial [Acidobacteriota bacterium]